MAAGRSCRSIFFVLVQSMTLWPCLHSISLQMTWSDHTTHASSRHGLLLRTHIPTMEAHKQHALTLQMCVCMCAVCDETCAWSACAQVCEAAASVQGSWRQQPGQCGLSYEGKGVPGEHTTHTLYSPFSLDDGLPPWVLPPHVDNPMGLSLMPYCLGQHWLSDVLSFCRSCCLSVCMDVCLAGLQLCCAAL